MRLFNARKGQSGIELLSNYAWAIIAVLVIIGALWYFDVLSPASVLPDTCSFPINFKCQGYSVSDGVIKIVLANNELVPIIIKNVDISSEALNGICSDSFDYNLAPEESATITANAL